MATGKITPGSQLSPGQAAYVLERMLRERRLSMGDVNGYLAEMKSEIAELEQRLDRLREASGNRVGADAAETAPTRAAAPARRRGRPPAAASAEDSTKSTKKAGGAKSRRKRSAVTAEQLASRQLQGRYLALVRQFPAGRRPIYARIARERGREAAIKAMQDAVGKK